MSSPAPCSPPPGSKKQQLGHVLRYRPDVGQADVALTKPLALGQCVEIVRPPSKWQQTVAAIWLGDKQVDEGKPGQTVRFDVLKPVLRDDRVYGFVTAGAGGGGGGEGGGGGGGGAGNGGGGGGGGGGRGGGRGKVPPKKRRGGG